MRLLSLGVVMVLAADGGSSASDPFEKMKTLVGEWQADLAGFGRITSSIRLVSKGMALEETLGTPADNEISLYTPSDSRVLLTHVCALTPDGHIVRAPDSPARGGSESPQVPSPGLLESAHTRRTTHAPGGRHLHRWRPLLRGMDEDRGREGHGLRAEVRASLTLWAEGLACARPLVPTHVPGRA